MEVDLSAVSRAQRAERIDRWVAMSQERMEDMNELDEAALAASVNARMAADEAAERGESPRPSLKVLEAVSPGQERRMSPREQQIVADWNRWVEPKYRQPSAPPAPSLSDERVPDRFRPGSGVLEASVADVPPAQRGHREALLNRGMSRELVDAWWGAA